MDKVVTFIIALFVAFLSMYMWQVYWASHEDPILDGVDAPDPLLEHTDEFDTPEIIKVTEGVYVAVGFAIANSIMLEGDDGIVIVDTTESHDAASEILREFRNITSKPIKGIILTHNHPDHTIGTEVFIEDPENPPPIISHELLIHELSRHYSTAPKLYHGAVHQFGIAFNNPKALVNAGLGPRLRVTMSRMAVSLKPTVLVDGKYNEMEIAGLKLVLIHIPGETPDQLGVWLPEKRTLLPADDIYRTFPNLYAIRGTPPRDVMVWANSLQKMMDLNPAHLVPSHTQPFSGEEKIQSNFKAYRDAIRYIHDQTVRLMNKGLHPDEIGTLIKLPPSLASHPYLMEFYGTVEWSAKSVYNQYIGWFSGDPNELHPLTPKDTAERMMKMVGRSKLLEEASAALAVNDPKWALQLASYVFITRPDDVQAKDIRLQALRKLASKEMSANGRHHYLTTALDDHKLINWKLDITETVKRSSLDRIFEAMKVRLKAEHVEGEVISIGFNFTDINQVVVLHVENSVLHVTYPDTVSPDQMDAVMTTTSDTFRSLLLRTRNPISAYVTGDIVVQGSTWTLKKVMDSFERGVED